MAINWGLLGNEDKTVNVQATRSINRLANEATITVDDPDGSVADQYVFGDQILAERDDGRRWIGIKTGDTQRLDRVELEANSYDYYLQRQVTQQWKNTAISDILKALIDKTPINWNPDNVTVQNDRQITWELRGEPIKSGIDDLSRLSAKEDFGVQNRPTVNEFFFRPRGSESAPYDFTEDNYLTAEFGEDDRKEINRVVVYYGEGENRDKVVKEDAEAQSNLGDSPVYDGNAVLQLSKYYPQISSETVANEKASALLEKFSEIQYGTIYALDAYDLDPGQETRVVNSRNNIDDQFRIVEIQHEWLDTDTVRVAEAVDGILETLTRNKDETRRIEHHNVADQTDEDQSAGGSGSEAQRNPTVIEEQTIPAGETVGFRDYVPGDVRMRVDTIGVLPQGLSPVTDLTAEVVDASDGSVLLSTNQKRQAGTPIDVFEGELDVEFRINNATSSSQTAGARFVYSVIESLRGFASVSITGTNSPINSGSTLDVDLEVENTGAKEITQDIVLLVDGTQEDTQTDVTLAAGASTTLTLSWVTDSNDDGEYTVRVESDDNAATTTAKVGSSVSQFDVTVTGSDEPVESGNTLTVDATVKNTGNAQDSQDIALSANGSQRDLWPGLNLQSGESKDIQLQWATEGVPEGNYTAEVASNDDSDTTTVEVFSGGYLQVTITGTNSPVTAGDSLDVQYEVENIGSNSVTQDIALLIDGTQEDVDTGVSVPAGGVVGQTLSWATEDGDAGDYTATVESEDDTATASVSVEVPTDGSDATGTTKTYEVNPSEGWGIWANDTAVYLGGSGVVSEINPADGSVVWDHTHNSAGGEVKDVIEANGTVYSCDWGGKVVAASSTDGTFKWEHTHHTNNLIRGLAYNNGVVYSGASDGKIIAADADGGGKLWEIDDYNNNSLGGVLDVAYDNGKIYASRTTPLGVVAYDASTQNEVWENQYFENIGITGDALSANNGIVILAGQNGNIERYDESDGTRVWDSTPTSQDLTDVSIRNGAVYTTGNVNIVISLNPSNGNTNWTHTYHDDGVDSVDANSDRVFSSEGFGGFIRADLQF